jgi:iron complex transport system ATP-binding protein
MPFSLFVSGKFALPLPNFMKEKAIEISNLTIGYKTKKQVTQVAGNLHSSIYQGELTCLLGANGVGKSTLLRTLSGFQPSLSGEIFIRGKEINVYTKKEIARMIGVVLTEKIDVRDMSVTELIELGRSPYTGFWGKPNKTDKTIVKKAIALMKIENLALRPVQTLSDGERQKVMIAKALAQETPVIYLDEPTAFLDFPSKVDIIRLLHRLCRQANKTIFLSTHDLELALQMADKLWLMDKEKGVTVGTPRELTLNGSMEYFFQCEGVVFDRETGLFRIKKIDDSLF